MLKRILAVMVVLLIFLVGAGLYYANLHTDHGPGALVPQLPGVPGKQVPAPGEAPDTKTPKEKVNIILEPDLRNYIDEVNKGISLINEANGLITADPFFADPPRVPKGPLETTPFDRQLPENRDQPVLLLPDGTYTIIRESGVDMRNIHRGIYKLGQGMTVLNTVLDRMNEDIRNNNFPVRGFAPSATYPYWPHQGMQGVVPNPAPADAGHPAATHGVNVGAIFGGEGLTNIMYIILLVFILMAIISVIGFIVSLFRPRTEDGTRPD